MWKACLAATQSIPTQHQWMLSDQWLLLTLPDDTAAMSDSRDCTNFCFALIPWCLQYVCDSFAVFCLYLSCVWSVTGMALQKVIVHSELLCFTENVFGLSRVFLLATVRLPPG